jgi:phage gp36-like protein
LQQIQAERQLRNAKPQDKDQARRRFKEALRNFTALVMDGKVPLVKGQ